MSTTATAPPPMVAQILKTLEHENQATMKALKALPADKLDYKPHERSRSARELAWHIAYSPYGCSRVVATGKFENFAEPNPPATLAEIVAGRESYYQKAREELSRLTPQQLEASLALPNGQQIPCAAIMWSFVVFHEIHHRGQLSVYIRTAGGKVPSIYGPSADDNPFA